MSAPSSDDGFSKGTTIIIALCTMAFGFFLGGRLQGGGSGPLAIVPAAAVPDSKVERYRIPLTGKEPAKGAEHAKVTIVQWSDFQCPYCGRVEPTVDQILKTYGREVKVVWKNNPLPFHPNAMPAAEAAMEAHAEGKFWKLHDIMFKNQATLDRPNLEKYITEAGVDLDKAKAAIDQNKYQADIKAEIDEAANFGARGTPAFFVNGRLVSGAQPFAAFKTVIDEEIANADKAMKAGVSLAQVYDALTRAGQTKAGATKPDAQKPAAPAQAQQDPNAVYKVPVGNSPQLGPSTAKVTIIQVSDFQCPYCSKVEPTIAELEKTYGKDLRVVWKNKPLPFHPNAMPAAEAAMAANEQGKFWPMHDKLFADQKNLGDATYEKYAEELGLNMSKWKAAVAAKKFEQSIKDDIALAEKFGASGTPGFFINGRPLRGAQPIDAFKTVIDKEIQAADALLKKGVKPANLYEELTKNGKDHLDVPAAAPAAQRPGQPDENTVYKALIEDAPVKGAKNAKVTIVMWSDYQCPYCSRVEPTVKQVMDTYGAKDVRLAFKELPLPMHDKAHLAAEAALAAKAQGKFWEMHDLMFANQKDLDRPSLEKYASQLGLNMDKFKSDLDSGKWKAKVDAEAAEGNKIGARGTPSFFVNGKSFVGAQPFDAFKAKIEAELANADAMIKKGTPVAKVYDELMKTAKAEVAATPAAQGGPPDDNKIYKVDAGNGPSKGPKNAPVQIVMFSDFQCPYCSRVEPTVKQIEEKYGNKIHLTWRNYPLPFHDKAQTAAEAAMAANEQGKFWEMHDKMFANQQAIDRPSLEKYASDLGLNMDKFKAALDSGKFKATVAADKTYADGLGTGGMGTPTFFINGHQVAGALPIDAFSKIIDGELAKKGGK